MIINNINRMTKTNNISLNNTKAPTKANEINFTGNVRQECVTIADFLADCAHSYGDKWCKNAKKIISEAGPKTPEKESLTGFFNAIGQIPGFLIKGNSPLAKITTITDKVLPAVVKDNSILERLAFMSERLKERVKTPELSKSIDEWKTFFKK